MKRAFLNVVLALLLGGVLLFGFGNKNAQAGWTQSSTDGLWSLYCYDGWTASIAKYYGSVRDLVIPSVIDGRTIIAIEEEAFRQSSLRSVVLPDTVKTIGKSAFSGCTSLTSVTLSPGLENIGDGAFYYCPFLTSLVLPDSVTTIGADVFEDCLYLKSVTLSCNLKEIPNDAFYGCHALESITLPDSITTIGAHAFHYCDALKSVTLPSNLKEIQGGCFEYCTSLTSISLPEGLQTIGAVAFQNCTSLSDVDLPDSLTSLGLGAFQYSGIKEVTIPHRITTLDGSPFAYCASLEKVVLHAGVKDAGGFYGCTSLTTLVVPEGVEQLHLSDCTALTELTLPFSMENFRFKNCPLMVLQVPEGSVALDLAIKNGYTYTTYKMTGFGYEVIWVDAIKITDYYDSDADVVIPAVIDGYQVTEIGQEAFYKRTEIKSVVIPEGVTYIGQYAFAECKNLKKVTLPSTLVTIADYAFWVHGLSSLTLPENLVSIGECAFASNPLRSSIAKLTIPGNVEEIMDGAFSGVPIGDLVLSEGLRCLGYQAFYECGIGTLTIPASVDNMWGHPCGDANIKIASGNKAYKVQDGAVYTMNGYVLVACIRPDLKSSFTVPAGVTRIGISAFEWGSLTSVTLPEGLVRIDKNAFANCHYLTDINLPSTLRHIGEQAFYCCLELPSLRIPDVLYTCYANAFNSCHELTLTVPYGSLTHYNVLNYKWQGFGSTAEEGRYKTVSPGKMIRLPASTEYIAAEAFEYSPRISYVIIPEGTTSIGSSAFYGCTDLMSVTIPASVEFISSSAFGSCRYLVIVAPSGSYAIDYAKQNGIPYIVE